MGYQDREYWQEQSASWRGGSAWGRGPQSITVTLILINLAVFVIDMFSEKSSPGMHWLGEQLALRSSDWQHPWMVWRLLTYGFVHAPFDTPNGVFHILGNMLALFFLGRVLESDYGRLEFLKFYLLAIAIAGGVWLATTGWSEQPRLVVGASGGVAAVLVLFAFKYPRVSLHLFGIWPIPAWILAAFVVGTDILRSFDPNSHVAAQCHLAGAAFAALYYRMGWNFHWLQFQWLTKLFSRHRRLRVYRGDSQIETLREQADRVLDKISSQGEASLTRKERKILEKYSQWVRERQEREP